MSNTSIPDNLKGWVIESDENPTEVMEPLFVDPRGEELRSYHPDPADSYELQLVHDPDGGDFAKSVLIGDNWNDQLQLVVKDLELRPVKDGDETIMLIDTAPAFPGNFSGWKVTEWRVSKTKDAKGDDMFIEFIIWAHLKDASRDNIISFYGWRPYKKK